MEGNENQCTTCREIINEADNQFYKCDSCLRKIHKDCVNLTASEVKCMPLQKRMLLLICTDCRKLLVRLPYIVKLLDGIKEDIRELKERKMSNEVGQSSRTYAETLDNNSSSVDKKVRSTPSLVIKPKNGQNVKTTRQEICRSINPTELKIGIKSVKTTKQGNVVVKCATKREIDILKETAKNTLDGSYEVEVPKMRFPKIKIAGFTGVKEAKELEGCIRSQNSWIDAGDKLEITYLKQKRDKGESTIFAECSPILFNKMMKHKKVFIDWERCAVYENLSVTRCFRCQAFYHKSSTCTREKVCGNCAGNHVTAECKSQVKKCQNCSTANSVYKTGYNDNHAVNDPICPSYKYHIEVLRSRIDYGS